MGYSFLEHTADVKFVADGPDLESMFVSAAEALNDVIRGKIEILEQSEKPIEIQGKNLEETLYSFLEEILYLLDAEDFLVAKIKNLEIENFKLKCILIGDKAENYKFTNDVKAVTYSEMYVKQTEKEWKCQVVLDV